MECMEARALKSKELRELGMKSNQQAFLDNIWCFNGASGVSSDDFCVDRFLDFSAGEFDDGASAEEEERDYLSVSSQDNNSNSAGYSFNYLLPDELSVPVDDVAGLEWVSQLVDDSLSEIPQLYQFSKQKTDGHAKPDPKLVSVRPACFFFRGPAKARTKRPRTARRDLSKLSVFLTKSSSSCSSNSEPPMKKPKKKPRALTGGLLGGYAVQRRCSHCQVLKTPQWRTGPLGAKTLCNACGVRYKSGRLFPEYRPACSPTFLADIHSNSHRRVLEIRKIKEKEVALVGVEPGLNLVHSF